MFQKLEKDLIGYQLRDLGSSYEFHSRYGIYRGSIKDIIVYAVYNLGFKSREIILGVSEMDKNFHNCAEFGTMKRFMYTFDNETNSQLH